MIQSVSLSARSGVCGPMGSASSWPSWPTRPQRSSPWPAGAFKTAGVQQWLLLHWGDCPVNRLPMCARDAAPLMISLLAQRLMLLRVPRAPLKHVQAGEAAGRGQGRPHQHGARRPAALPHHVRLYMKRIPQQLHHCRSSAVGAITWSARELTPQNCVCSRLVVYIGNSIIAACCWRARGRVAWTTQPTRCMWLTSWGCASAPERCRWHQIFTMFI
jgi:hypothetical protein